MKHKSTVVTREQIRGELKRYSSRSVAENLKRYFKTGPGGYGEGDVFWGVKVPDIRKISVRHRDLGINLCTRMLKSPVHEERMLALLILVLKYSKSGEDNKKKIYEVYLKHTRFINNWDLVDLTAGHIVGSFLMDRNKEPLYRLAGSGLLWERRIAIIATSHFIKNRRYDDTLKISGILLSDKHDLIHKAVGWMLREIGKRDISAEEGFLRKYYKVMPRTMLRYAIEKFPEKKRQGYLKGSKVL